MSGIFLARHLLGTCRCWLMKQTSRRVIVYYLVGIFTASLIHISITWERKYLMPNSYIVVIMFGLAALPWAALNLLNLLCPVKRRQNLGELIAHWVFLFLIVLVAVLMW